MSLVSLALFVVAVLAIRRILEEISYAHLLDAVAALSAKQITVAALFTLASYVVLTGYDWSALRYLRRRVPYRTIALATFCGCAISNAVGFNILSGASVRYRIYVPAGLNSLDVAGITVFGMAAFSVGVSLVTAVAVVVYPEMMAGLIAVSPTWLRIIGILAMIPLIGLVVLSFLRRAPVRIGWWHVRLPTGRIAVAQLLVTLVDIVFAGGCLYVLIDEPAVPFLGFLAVYVVGVQAGMISHVPGGLGIFESLVLLSFRHQIPIATLAAALLMYRAIYYLAPLILAATVLLGREILERLPQVERR